MWVPSGENTGVAAAKPAGRPVAVIAAPEGIENRPLVAGGPTPGSGPVLLKRNVPSGEMAGNANWLLAGIIGVSALPAVSA